MDAGKLDKLKNAAKTVIQGCSELKACEYKRIELSEFQEQASPEIVLTLIDELANAQDSVDFYKRRVEMRDPERTIACDIIANGQTLPPENAGNRYVIAKDNTQELEFEIQRLNQVIKQMAEDLTAIQEMHNQQKARLYSEKAAMKFKIEKLVETVLSFQSN